MGKFTGSWEATKQYIRTDENLSRARFLVVNGAKRFPSSAGSYLLDKVPVVQWLPNYSPKWFFNDVVAGVTVALLLIPQALAYASLAKIPLQDGLLASWLPSVIYFFMGTSKDVSTGPTSIIGLLTGEMVIELSKEGIAPATTAATIAFSIGIISLITGLLKLGWLLDFVSHPVLTGFITGASIIIISGQVPALLGESKAPSAFIHQFPFIFKKLGTSQPKTVTIGISAIVILLGLQYIGQKWGKKSRIVWAIATSRNAIVLGIFTAISYALNKDTPKKPVWAITGTIPSGLQTPRLPTSDLIQKVLPKSFPIFIAASLEHIAICAAFGRRNHYLVNPSQELSFLGVTNILNGIFGGMAVGGAISRTSVNNESGVRSPLGGLFTTTLVLLGVFFLTGVLFWIPKAVLAAVIIVAVIKIVPSYKVFVGFWKTSFVDFVASLTTALITLLVSAELGIEIGVALMVAYTLLRAAFTRARKVTVQDLEEKYKWASPSSSEIVVGRGTHIISLSASVFFVNAARVKSDIMESIRTYFTHHHAHQKERNWTDPKICVKDAENLGTLIAKPTLHVLVLDFSRVDFVDATGMEMLHVLKEEMKSAKEPVEIRFVGFNGGVLKRFGRVGWKLVFDFEEEEGDRVFKDLRDAVRGRIENRDEDVVVEEKGFGVQVREELGRMISEGSVMMEKGSSINYTP
ncbi:SulP family sulfate permease [Amylocarpus encephaloides]|uniref:SulP family sulfate permease n=1 Tax=Amylocarpus encephaloides TaxID=45428 RepID=A0A9P7YA41_9HELO|nr:SulP family sulfate permease [Amylocarpus encephaloides]